MSIPVDETFSEKIIRKTRDEPFVPIGAAVTTYFLFSGLRAFHQGKQATAQKLMRGRVAAQAFTVIAMAYGAYIGFKPHDRPKDMEEVLQRKRDEDAKLGR
jgi:hypothetical protein